MSANGLLEDAASPPKQGCEELLIDTARELLGDTGGMSDLSMLRRASPWPIWALTAKCSASKAVKQLQAVGSNMPCNHVPCSGDYLIKMQQMILGANLYCK